MENKTAIELIEPATSMSAEVVYSGAGVEAAVQGNLFRGQKFWLAQKVPTRSTYLSLILV